MYGRAYTSPAETSTRMAAGPLFREVVAVMIEPRKLREAK
jgi:hypothetical protein